MNDPIKPYNFRFPSKLVANLDKWLMQLQKQPGAPADRSALVRDLLTWACEVKPEFRNPNFILELHDTKTNEVLDAQRIFAAEAPNSYTFPKSDRKGMIWRVKAMDDGVTRVIYAAQIEGDDE